MEEMMRIFIFAALVALGLDMGGAFAQAPAPAPQPAAPAKTSASNKMAISKSCTDQANAKGLHGRARKKFRSACKKAGGKM
jgi:hypothetical protein